MDTSHSTSGLHPLRKSLYSHLFIFLVQMMALKAHLQFLMPRTHVWFTWQHFLDIPWRSCSLFYIFWILVHKSENIFCSCGWLSNTCMRPTLILVNGIIASSWSEPHSFLKRGRRKFDIVHILCKWEHAMKTYIGKIINCQVKNIEGNSLQYNFLVTCSKLGYF